MLIKTGLAVSQMSGTMGGVVASHNRNGQYFRRWTKPTDPKSTSQMLRRAALAAAVDRWRALSGPNKATWEQYASNTPWKNRLGETTYLTGAQHYTRVFSYLKYLADSLGSPFAGVGECKSAGGLPANISQPVATLSLATGLSLAYDDSADWCDLTGSGIIIRMSEPRNGSQVFSKGPYTFAGAIMGDSVTPPESPYEIETEDLPYAIAVGRRVDFVMRRLDLVNYVISNETKVSVVVTA